jgi:hypothetical protein
MARRVEGENTKRWIMHDIRCLTSLEMCQAYVDIAVLGLVFLLLGSNTRDRVCN